MEIKGYINYGHRPPAPFIAVIMSLKELSKKSYRNHVSVLSKPHPDPR